MEIDEPTMEIDEPLTEYGGLPVVTFDPGKPGMGAAGAGAGEVAWRVATFYEGPKFADRFARFVETVDTAAVTALVIGYWDMEPLPVEALTGAAASFPNLRALSSATSTSRRRRTSPGSSTPTSPVLRAFPAWSGSRSAARRAWSCRRSGATS
ncbi:hypothetical protein [Actinomadura sp. WMMB 499]|uniref:hypothetical protein n=1 Tax=Actinomadura sp. WMMB 499 TaxID=1219491 RepID=UPI00159E6F6D|nr:hypothetical protein [Actinomadura sp. WMMB 499]